MTNSKDEQNKQKCWKCWISYRRVKNKKQQHGRFSDSIKNNVSAVFVIYKNVVSLLFWRGGTTRAFSNEFLIK